MSTTRYFTHVDGFCDGTAYIEVGDFGTRLVGESGAREDSTWTLDECVGNCREKVWKEMSEADVLALNIPAAPVDPRDAEIAALTEKLRAVEAERDEVQRNLELYHEVVGLIERDLSIEPMSTTKTIGGELSALRAELERKDAVILNLYQFAEHSDACWRDEVSRDRPCVCGLDNALKEADVELQPKEPPCQTA